MAKKYQKLIFDYMDNTFFEKFNQNSHLTLFKYLENRKEEEKRNFKNKVSNIHFMQLISDKAQAKSSYDNKIAFITTIDESKYLIFAEIDYSLVVYNLILPDVIIKIPNAHENHINSVTHKIHPITKKHYILTSSYDLSVKVWLFDCKKGELKNILKIPMAGYDHGLLATLIFNQASNCNYVITCSLYKNISIWNFNDGKALKKVETKNYLFFIDSFYDKNQDKNYVIVGSDSNVQSWTEDLTIYKIYSNGQNSNHYSVYVSSDLLVYSSSIKGSISIWNFHTAELITDIDTGYELYGICLWNTNTMLIGTEVGKVIQVDIESNEISTFSLENVPIKNILKVINALFGKGIISYTNDGKIKYFTCE